MTELLQRAIAAVEKLPADVQDAIAARLLAEVLDEQAWTAGFEVTTDALWDRMAQGVRRAIARGEVSPIDEVLPPGRPL